MDSAKELSIGFLTTHPEGAVPVLEAIAPDDAAAYLKDVPDDMGGRALEMMQPLVAAAILSRLTPKKAAAVLLAMDIHGRSCIMRVLDDGIVGPIMGLMPKGIARDLARFLKYPDGSVGAWMSSDILVFETSTAVGECLEKLRAVPDKVRSLIFVVDNQKKLVGAVDLAELLRAPDDVGLGTLADIDIKRLSPFARLTSIVALAAWDTALSLPVVDAKGRLLGVLHFDRLREGLVSEHRVGKEKPMGQIIPHMAEAFLVCAAGVLHRPSAKPVLSRPTGDLET